MNPTNQLLTTIFLLLFSTTLAFAQAPCSTEGYRQFDFWVGEWNVYHATADTIVGRNHVKLLLNDCVIEENWTGASGSIGKSFNTYNAIDSTWNQVWVDGAGNTLHFSGKYKDNVMQLYGTSGTGDNIVHFDMAYHYDPDKKTVRQIWKTSRDGGKSWQLAFDGIYRR